MSDPLGLVALAALDVRQLKDALSALEACEPSEEVVHRVLAAHERGELAPWTVAALLGRNGHAAGYERVHAILRSADGPSESYEYAAPALFRIDAARAEDDLADVIDASDTPRARKASASVLGRLGSSPALDRLLGALRRGRLFPRFVAEATAQRSIEHARVLAATRDPALDVRRWAALLVAIRARRVEHHPDAHLERELAEWLASPELHAWLSAIPLDDGDLLYVADARILHRALG